MKVLLLGANGQVGHELRRCLAATAEVVATTRNGMLPDGSPCEVADFDAPESLPALIERIAPDVVVNAAAYTAVDRAESDRDAAFRANAISPGMIARSCAERGIRFIHYSTDYVFDGSGQRPYREDDPTSPLGVYGESKLAGEQAIAEAGGAFQVFRTAWVYGNHGHNFMKTMLRLGAERSELGVVGDQFGTPTPAGLIADATAKALERTLPNRIYHLTATGQTSWHGFAEAIFRHAQARQLLSNIPVVKAITTADYPTPARRPGYSCLDTAALSHDLQITLPDWETALDEVLAQRG